MEKEITSPLDLLEHERFHGFFDCAVAELTVGRKKGKKYKRSAYDSLLERGILGNEELRKAEIYLCGQKRSNLSRRERDLLEYLTIQAGAKLIAWINRPQQNVKENDTE